MYNALDGLVSYGGEITLERERMLMQINGRYPFVVLCGPWSVTREQFTQVSDEDLDYVVKYFINYNDESISPDTEVNYVVRTVVEDITRAVQVDTERNGLAQVTELIEYGTTQEIVEDSLEFLVYAKYRVQALINADNPYVSG